MSCFGTIILVLVPRIAILLWWLADSQLFNLAFKNWALPGTFAIPAWVWTLLGGIFLPWTTLAYLFVFPGASWAMNGLCWGSPSCSTWPGMAAATTTATASQSIEEVRQYNKGYQWQRQGAELA